MSEATAETRPGADDMDDTQQARTHERSGLGGKGAPPAVDGGVHALFLDFDGTLVDFADHPDAVHVPAALRDLLSSLHERLDGALALVSGRAIASIDALLAPLELPAAGVHGAEIRRPGMPISKAEAIEAGLAPARDLLARRLPADDPIRIEDKGAAIVLHTRTAPDHAARACALAREAAALHPDLVAVDGHAIAEIRPRMVTKAGAIAGLMEGPPFSGRQPVFVGDDTTDEDGFRAAAAAGGFGIKVGAGDTAARFRLADVAAVHDWLARSLAMSD